MSALVQQSRAVMQHHARSFAWAAAFLSPAQADDAAVLYHFCRLVDDTVDEAVDARTAGQGLARLRAELQGVLPPRGVLAALFEVADRTGLDLACAAELIEGCRSDLDLQQIADDRELLRYCYRVAGTVGLMMCSVLGVEDPRARAFAIDLGVGMQLTNICRDVLEDARRGRTYLPDRRLRAHGASAARLISAPEAARPAVVAVTTDLLALADRYYDSAMAGLRYLPWRARFAVLVAARIYRAIGTQLRRAGADPLQGRTVVTAAGKTFEVLRSLADFFRPRVLGLTLTPNHDASLHAALGGLPGANVSAPERPHALLDPDRRREDRHPEEHADRLGAAP